MPAPELSPEILAHYNRGRESSRLTEGALGRLEFERIQSLLARHLPPAPVVILDVGGGAGVHALALAQRGFEVHLLDPVELHLQQARSASQAQPGCPLASIRLADARAIPRADSSIDAVLLFGPLYHLTDRADRLAALREARRVLRPGGWLFAVAVSRYASLLDGFAGGLIDDPAFVRIMLRDLADGQHRNPTDHATYFTTAFFHHPDEFRSEIGEAGFAVLNLVGVQGPAWALRDLGVRWADENRRAELLRLLERIDTDPVVIATSFHFLAVARRA